MRKQFLLVAALVAAVCLVAIAPAANAAVCNATHGNCDASVSLTVFTGVPTPVCLIGHPVVLIRVTVTCGGQSAGVFEKKICGIHSTPFVFEALGYEHTLKPNDGYDWEAILGGACGELDYRRKPL